MLVLMVIGICAAMGGENMLAAIFGIVCSALILGLSVAFQVAMLVFSFPFIQNQEKWALKLHSFPLMIAWQNKSQCPSHFSTLLVLIDSSTNKKTNKSPNLFRASTVCVWIFRRLASSSLEAFCVPAGTCRRRCSTRAGHECVRAKLNWRRTLFHNL